MQYHAGSVGHIGVSIVETTNGIQYILERKKGKRRLTVRVYPKGYVKVSAPLRAKQSDIETFVSSHAQWITTTLGKVLQTPEPLPPHTYGQGDTFLLFDTERVLQVVPLPRRCTAHAWFEKDSLVVQTSSRSKAAVKALVIQTYSREGLAWYGSTVDRLLASLRTVHASFPDPASVGMAPYPTRLGTCSSTGHIRFALRSLMLPPHLCEYIVLHELLHLVCFNHGKDFKKLLSLHMPDWKTRKDELSRLSRRISHL